MSLYLKKKKKNHKQRKNTKKSQHTKKITCTLPPQKNPNPPKQTKNPNLTP